MADNSKFVLRWEIDNAAARSATGRMGSGVFEKGGFEWTIDAERLPGRSSPDDMTTFTLSCDVEHNRLWKCETDIEARILFPGGGHFVSLNKTRFRFDENISFFENRYNTVFWSHFIHPSFTRDDKVTIEFVINITSSDRGQPLFDARKFDTPNTRSNVILVIGDKRLHVSKEILAISSPVFETMFFGDFVEKGKEEVEIKDVVYEEFVDLLHLVYPGFFKITDSTVIPLLLLSDQFQIEHIHYSAEAHLRTSKRFTTAEKLEVADKYRLNGLRDYCLHTYTNSQSLRELQLTREYASFSDDMKVAICDLIKKNHQYIG